MSGQVALEAEEEQEAMAEVGDDCMDGFMGATDDSWDDWEEWMGWEGAGITDYSSHENPSYGCWNISVSAQKIFEQCVYTTKFAEIFQGLGGDWILDVCYSSVQ